MPEITLTAGTRVGPYEVLSPLGAGGMGQVYRARDTRLKRDVAIKVLPAAFATDSDRLHRFQREAELLATLNHPNIGAVYGLETIDNTPAIVLELIEGDTLADVLSRGAMPVDEALAIARQIAAALEAAHEKGITHRDLKPANIKTRLDGPVKVLDFGLATMAPASPDDAANSPTFMAPTGVGMIVGTAAYMAPEQARGMPVDKRADIWAFGVVVYELLTGKQLFTGESTTDILAAVVRGEPDFRALPPSTPEPIRRLLKRCLEKDRRKRLPDIGVARLEIDDALAGGTVADAPARARQAVLPWLVAAVFALAAVASFGLRTRPQSQWVGTRLSESSVAIGPRVSPDGKLVAFLAMVDGVLQAAVMKPETGNWTVLSRDRSRGSPSHVSWSGDGAKLYFDRFSDVPRGVFSVPVLGGDEQLVVEDAACPQPLPDGSLVVVRLNAERIFQLYQVWPDSGRVRPLKTSVAMPTANAAFRSTPDGRRLVFFGKPLDDPAGSEHLYTLDLSSEKITRLAPDAGFSFRNFFALGVSADGRSAFVDLPVDDTHRIVSVPLDGTGSLQPLPITLTGQVGGIEPAGDGSLYVDQWDRPTEILRVRPDGGSPERVATMPWNPVPISALPLPDGRILFTSRTFGRERVVLIAPGREPSSFVESTEETAGPLALVGQTHVAFTIGPRNSRTIALASVTDRRITRRLERSKGAAIDSLVAAPDGKTIYYAASGSIWAIPADDGQPRKVRSGDSITIDPERQEFVVRITDKDGTRLVRAPIAGGPDRPLALPDGVRVAPIALASNAVSRDGRIVAQLVPAQSWFWPAGIIDRNGQVQMIPIGYDADVGGGWTPDGKILVSALGLRVSLWRFRPSE